MSNINMGCKLTRLSTAPISILFLCLMGTFYACTEPAGNPDEIRQQSENAIEALEALSRETFSRWIERFEIAPRRRSLPSR